MNYRIPTIEEIYNEYHRDTFFASKGVYPRSIKNFDKVLTSDKIELLTRFQNMLKRNVDMIDWKLYIKACSDYFKRSFDLKILGSLQGNKIYRNYIAYDNIEKSAEEIENEIKNSLSFIKIFCKDNEINVVDYFKDRSTVFPIALKHLYSGSVSPYFYGIFSGNNLIRLFGDITDDVFEELFGYTRNDLFEYNILKKRERMLKSDRLLKIINIINDKFKNKI